MKNEKKVQNKASLVRRLSRIEGQVRGIKNMVEKENHYTDVLVQVMAVNAALNSFNKELVAYEMKTKITQDIMEGERDSFDELLTNVHKLMK
ncbi:MAG: metal-sensing transcriptional repressor [Lachnospiraceae bacterium]|nr:metal-sensing transcriptional repressor [Lachnospiraceae bacterium]